MTRATKRRLTLAGIGILAATVIGVGRFTDLCRLEVVTLNGTPVANPESQYGLVAGKYLLDQPVKTAAAKILQRPDVVQVDVEYSFPNRLHLKTNRFTVVAFILDNQTGRLHGLNADTRVLPLPENHADWAHPVLTGVDHVKLYERCGARVRTAVAQMEKLRTEHADLYLLIDEIDFRQDDAVVMRLSGADYAVLASPDRLYTHITEFWRFLERFPAATAHAERYDLRFENMIVKQGADTTDG
jgi:cell division septal protein FtsQ